MYINSLSLFVAEVVFFTLALLVFLVSLEDFLLVDFFAMMLVFTRYIMLDTILCDDEEKI